MSGGSESGDPSPSNLDYYAYALDGVAPLVGGDAPASVHTAGSDTGASRGLTLAQVQAIYECVDNNWDQITVNGVTGSECADRVVLATVGVGTWAVDTDVLGFDPTKQVAPSVCTTTTEPITGFANSTPNE